MARKTKRTEAAFVVRLWCEAGATAADPLRGGVQNLVTGERLFFSEMEDLNAFMLSHLQAERIRITQTR